MRTLSARRLEAALAAGDYSGARIMDAVVNRLNRTLQPAEGGNRSAAATVAAVPLLAVGTLWGGGAVGAVVARAHPLAASLQSARFRAPSLHQSPRISDESQVAAAWTRALVNKY